MSRKTIKCPITEHKPNHKPCIYYPETNTWHCHDCKQGGKGNPETGDYIHFNDKKIIGIYGSFSKSNKTIRTNKKSVENTYKLLQISYEIENEIINYTEENPIEIFLSFIEDRWKNYIKLANNVEVDKEKNVILKLISEIDILSTHENKFRESLNLIEKECSIIEMPLTSLLKDKKENCYKRNIHVDSKPSHTQIISNFIMEVTKVYIDQNNDKTYEMELLGKSKEVLIIKGETFATIDNFQKSILNKGIFFFEGSKRELHKIIEFETNNVKDNRVIYQLEGLGYFENIRLWLFPNIAVKNGKFYLPDKEGIIWIKNKGYKPITEGENYNFFSGAIPNLNTKNIDNLENEHKIIYECFKTLLGSEPLGLLGLGFIGSTLYSDVIFKHFRLFPRLDLFGITESGKTTYGNLLMSFFGFDIEGDQFSETTQYFVMKTLSYLKNIPYWLDEYKEGKSKISESYLKGIYNRGGSGKGTKVGTISHPIHSTLILSGETISDTPSLKSRTVRMNFYPKEKHTETNKQSLKTLLEKKYIFSSITLNAIKNRNKENEVEIIKSINILCKELLQLTNISRLSYIYAIVITGLKALGYEIEKTFLDWVKEYIKEVEKEQSETSTVNKFFESVISLINRKKISKEFFRKTSKGDKVYLCYNEVYDEVKKENPNLYNKDVIKKYIQDQRYFIDEMPIKTNIDNSLKNIKSLVFNFEESSVIIKEFLD